LRQHERLFVTNPGPRTPIDIPYQGLSLPELDPSALSLDDIELIEKISLRTVTQAVLDFAAEACREFQESPDDQQDIAEDLTREAVDTLGGYQIRKRLYGNIDYKRARWLALPSGLVPQALLVDSKAEKEGRTVTLQTSQVSMRIAFNKSDGTLIDEQGHLQAMLDLSIRPSRKAITTVIIVAYEYREGAGCHHRRCLDRIHVVAVPHARLEARYCPTPADTIWNVGRNSPTLGEEFRVRLSYTKLEIKARWRHQVIRLNEDCDPAADWAETSGSHQLRPTALIPAGTPGRAVEK
jgi:type II restriction enzyme SfiI